MEYYISYPTTNHELLRDVNDVYKKVGPVLGINEVPFPRILEPKPGLTSADFFGGLRTDGSVAGTQIPSSLPPANNFLLFRP